MVSTSSSNASAVSFPEKIQTALKALEDCRMCPRNCGVNRLENRWAACKTGRYAVVDCYFAHFGEEYCLRGWNGVLFALQSAMCLLPELRHQSGCSARTSRSGLSAGGNSRHDAGASGEGLPQHQFCYAGTCGAADYRGVSDCRR